MNFGGGGRCREAWPPAPKMWIDLTDFLRDKRPGIIAEWEEAVQALPRAAKLSRPKLIDFIPPLLDQIIDTVEQYRAGSTPDQPVETAELHALHRLEEGFDLQDVIVELAVLRDCIVRRWRGTLATSHPEQWPFLTLLHQAIDRAMVVCVERFTETRDRILRVLDRVSATALGAASLDELLERLIAAFEEEVPAVDTAAILLRKGDVLTVRAATGLEQEVAKGLSIPVGEGFAGKIAAEKRPIQLTSAATDPLIQSEVIRAKGVKALYGVPLLADGEVLGVAHIGSISAPEFSDQDRILFGAMASRATAGIHQHALRAQAEDRARAIETSERRLKFLSRASEVLTSTLDLQQTLQNVAELVVPVVADWCAVDVVNADGYMGELLAVAHRDPDKVAYIRELRRRYPPRSDAPSGVGKVIRTGQLELFDEIDDELIRSVAQDEAHLELISHLGLRSYLCVPMTQGGRVVGALSLATTESSRPIGADEVELAQELARRAGAAIENARLHRDVAQAVRLRDRILAIVSHDLRNPIGTISLAREALERNSAVRDDASSAKHLEVIKRATAGASRLIDDLLDVSSIQAGKLTLDHTSCQLSSLLSETVEAHEPLARDKGIALRVEGLECDHGIRCDRGRLQQVLANLVGNAIKFCGSGDRVVVRAETMDSQTVLVSVDDTGPGIAGDHIEHIFDLYWMAGGTKRGTGLGLFISKGIVESHGGRIWAESEIGRGTTVCFTVPLAG